MGVEEKYNSVRGRLDAFGYKAPLGIDSIPLVERLFADLVHTTGRVFYEFNSQFYFVTYINPEARVSKKSAYETSAFARESAYTYD